MGSKKVLNRTVCLLVTVVVLLAGLTGCSDSVENRREKVKDAIESATTQFGVTYTLDIKSNEQNNYVTEKGKKTYYYFNVYIEVNNADLSNEEIFDFIMAIDDASVSYTSIYRFYTFNGEKYYVQDECILICGHNYDIAYTPIAKKNGKGLTYTEKQAICDWLDSKYQLYDVYDGGYSGDKHSDELFELASQVFNIPVDDLEIIWMNRYTN